MPVVCSFPDEAALKSMPLRKPPTVKEHIRIVAIGDFEYVACGGTHPSSSGQVGLLKIVDARPSKGKLRLSFVCGKRAFRDYRRVYDLAHAAAAELSHALMVDGKLITVTPHSPAAALIPCWRSRVRSHSGSLRM